MEFFAVLIAWGAVQFWGSGAIVQSDDWFVALRRSLRKINGAVPRLLLTLSPLLLVALVLFLLGPILFGLPAFIISVVILLYSLGRGDFHIQLRLYLNSWQRGDLEGARRHGEYFDPELRTGAENALQLHQAVRKGVFYHGFERWFAVVFWFFLAGPVFALAYRLLFLIARHEGSEQRERDMAFQGLYYFEYLPARLLGFAFALIGHFDRCFPVWRQLSVAELPSDDYLDQLGATCLPGVSAEEAQDDSAFLQRASDELQAAQQMLSRSLLCWVGVMALIELF